MKNTVFLFLTAIVLAACNTACDPINPPVVVPDKFTIVGIAGPNGTISPSQVVVGKNGTATFKIIPNFGYIIDKFEDDGIALPPLETYTVMNISENDTFKVSFKFKYDVGTPEWYFTQFVWMETDTELLIDGYWYYFPMPDSDKKTYWYNPDGFYDYLFKGVTYKDASLTWSLDKTTNPITLVIGGKYLKRVEFINSTTIALSLDDRDVTHKITYTTNGVKRFK